MSVCGGTPDSHCCWLGEAGQCGFLEVDDPSRPGLASCTLRRRLGSWEAVHASGDYQTVGVVVRDLVGVDCGDWPPRGVKCASCEVTGNG